MRSLKRGISYCLAMLYLFLGVFSVNAQTFSENQKYSIGPNDVAIFIPTEGRPISYGCGTVSFKRDSEYWSTWLQKEMKSS